MSIPFTSDHFVFCQEDGTPIPDEEKNNVWADVTDAQRQDGCVQDVTILFKNIHPERNVEASTFSFRQAPWDNSAVFVRLVDSGEDPDWAGSFTLTKASSVLPDDPPDTYTYYVHPAFQSYIKAGSVLHWGESLVRVLEKEKNRLILDKDLGTCLTPTPRSKEVRFPLVALFI